MYIANNAVPWPCGRFQVRYYQPYYHKEPSPDSTPAAVAVAAALLTRTISVHTISYASE